MISLICFHSIDGYSIRTEDGVRRFFLLLLLMKVAHRTQAPIFHEWPDQMRCLIDGIEGTTIERHEMCDPSLQLNEK